MDLTTFLGILSSFGLVILAIVSQGSITIFFSWESLLIVLGGTFGAVLVNYPLGEVLRVFRVVKKAFFYRGDDLVDLVPKMVEYSRGARKDGLLILERYIGGEEDLFVAEGLRMIVDGVTPETIREVLSNEIDYLGERHRIHIGFNLTADFSQRYSGPVEAQAELMNLVGNLVNLPLPCGKDPSGRKRGGNI